MLTRTTKWRQRAPAMRPVTLLYAAGLMMAPLIADAASGELVVGVDAGYALLERNPDAQHGAAAHLTGWLGLTDTLWLSLSGGTLWFNKRGDSASRIVGEGLLGIVLALDVFRAIPYLELAAGIVGYAEDVDPTGRLAAGVDYFLTPQWVVGGVLRLRLLPEPLGRQGLTASVRIGYRFDL